MQLTDISAITTIESCATRSLAGAISFGEVVAALSGAGVESYHADYRRAEITYYMPDGATHVVSLGAGHGACAQDFDVEAVRAAILGAQRGQLAYPDFVARTCDAGCVGYTVWIAGRHVQYMGRLGQVHVERFPS